MIVFDLKCPQGHRFEGWFAGSQEFEDQRASGLLQCPVCGSDEIDKAPMAPAVPAKSNRAPEPIAAASGDVGAQEQGESLSNRPIPVEVERALVALAKAQAKALENSDYVGDRFAEESRAIHYGEAEERPIHGKASLEQAQQLIDEGIAISPLPFPVNEPDKLN